MKNHILGACLLLFCLYANLQECLAQPAQLVNLDFEDLNQIDSFGGVASGTLEQVPGIVGNGLSLKGASSVCFPVQTFLGEAQGTLQFWVKDLSSNGGLWEVTSVGTNKLWGSFKTSDEFNQILHYELQTASATFARSSRNWTSDTDWHFVVFTWLQGSTRTEFAIYLDGFAGSKPNLLGKVTLSPTSQFCLGKYSNKGSSNPLIDDLKTYNYVRNNAQILGDFLGNFNGCPNWPYIWRNPLNGADVNRDGQLDKYDTLHVLSALASGEQFDFLTCPNDTLPHLSLDVFADNILTEQDAQAALTALNNTLPEDQRISMQTLRLITHGDVNEDGVLNGDDLKIILQNQTLSVEIFTSGDINGDSLVDQKDLKVARKYISFEGDLFATLPRFKVQRSLTTQ